MKIALCSDIHLEFADLEIKNDNNADVLILAGDICIAEDLHDHPDPVNTLVKLGKRQECAVRYRNFFKSVSREYENVVYVAGNHEFYNGRWNGSIDHLIEECSAFKNVHFLENSSVEIDSRIFVGATLWTDLNKGDPLTLQVVSQVMNDYELIRNDSRGFSKLRPANALSRHKASLTYFAEEIKKHPEKEIVIVSHMAPSSKSIDEKYKGSGLENYAYFSDLSNFIIDHEQVRLWCHGHVHHHVDYEIGKTRIVCHPRGYVGFERGHQHEDPYFPYHIQI